jgi:hypothetical protein
MHSGVQFELAARGVQNCLTVSSLKDFRCAQIILSGVELMHMIRKGQIRDDGRGPVRSATILHAGGVTPTDRSPRGETVPLTFTRAPLNATEPVNVPSMKYAFNGALFPWVVYRVVAVNRSLAYQIDA